MKYFPRECILTLDELKAKCDEWKVILGLENWDIKTLLVRQSEIPGDQGECQWSLTNRVGIIKITTNEDWDNKYFKQDMEKTLVHELLHLHFSHIKDYCIDHNTSENAIFEKDIDLLARTLVGLKRDKAE